jgi:hypothetical protein
MDRGADVFWIYSGFVTNTRRRRLYAKSEKMVVQEKPYLSP